MAGMRRSFRHTADFLDHLFPADSSCLFDCLTLNQFRKRRGTRHGGHASFSAKADLGDPIAVQLHGELQNIPASRILQLCRSISIFDIARIARILKMIEKFR